nr:nickel-dependent lactate racemase [Clostridia bacterium]
MKRIEFPFGKEKLAYDFDEKNLDAVLTSSLHNYKPLDSEVNLVKAAMANPYGTERLSELAKGKNKVVIIASDHTRPVPSKVIIPYMLEEIRQGNKDADITILIATGCHRGTTKDELVAKFGEDIVKNEKIYVHDCEEKEKYTNLGKLPSGGECIINSIAAEADLLVSEGFIEPHFFAGYSGGRKSVLPGISSRETVLANHCAEFIDSSFARTGIIENNPIHRDMVWAARAAKLAYIVNVVINEEKKVVYAVAGDVERAHEAGCNFLSKYCGAKAEKESDIVISTNGGYPLDQNIYQSVKGMTAAEAAVRQGGVIIMIAKANDGTGGDEFYHCMNVDKSAEEIYAEVMTRGRGETVGDQWMTQILSRILMRATVIYVSSAPDELIKGYHMIPAKSLDAAMEKAKEILGNENASVTAIPDGVAVMVQK